MKLLHLVGLLSRFHGALPFDERYTRSLQENVERAFSVSTVTNAPVLMNLNCELGTSFLEHLVASHLIFELYDRSWRYRAEWAKMHLYAKTLMTRNSEDRFYLGLYCHPEGLNNERWGLELAFARDLIRLLPIPSHSFAMLWVTTSENFWDEPWNRFATVCTQIYAMWDKTSNDMILQTRENEHMKWYSSYLQLYMNFERSLETFVWNCLKFGRQSLRHLGMRRIRLKELVESVQHSRYFVELHDPQDRNISFILELDDVPLQVLSDPWESVWFSSYHVIVPVARVPSISKNRQIARATLRKEMWLPVISIAFAAAIVLKYTKEGFWKCFSGLVLCVVHPVNIDHRAKPKEFFMIVGTWILLIQVIKSLYQGNTVASMHGLPEDRVRSIRKCQHFHPLIEPNETLGYILEGSLTAFFKFELAAVLQGAVICKNLDRFEPLQESLLSNIPMYKLDSGPESIAHTRVYLMKAQMLNATDHSTLTIAGVNLDYKYQCCIRLAQRGLSSLPFRPTNLKQVSRKSHEYFREKFSETMKLKLSPKYGTEHCRHLDGGRKYRCFTLSDLHPPSAIGMCLENLVSSLLIGAAFILASSALFMLELCRDSASRRRARALGGAKTKSSQLRCPKLQADRDKVLGVLGSTEPVNSLAHVFRSRTSLNSETIRVKSRPGTV